MTNLAATVVEAGAVLTFDPLPTVLGDESQLSQLLQNLLANAIKYNRHQGEVGIWCDEPGPGRLRLGVSDTGQGIPPETVCLDPGIGFGKTLEHTLGLLANLGAFARFGRPICLGVSRKGFIGQICGRSRSERMPGSLAVVCFAAARGQAHVLRVHDVAPTRDAALLLEAIDRRRT